MTSTKAPWGKTVDVEFSNDITFVYFNRPDKKNCMSPTLNRETYATLHALELDDRCKVVVLSGRGAEFRQSAMHAFLDEKKFKPGLATYQKDAAKPKAGKATRKTSNK